MPERLRCTPGNVRRISKFRSTCDRSWRKKQGVRTGMCIGTENQRSKYPKPAGDPAGFIYISKNSCNRNLLPHRYGWSKMQSEFPHGRITKIRQNKHKICIF